MSDEAEFVDWLSKRITLAPNITLGIGDDAAIIPIPSQQELVMTTDLIAEGSHFESKTLPELIGRKALAVNLSDLAAMAARPLAATVSMLLDRRRTMQFAEAVMEGVVQLADEYRISIVGGDTNSWDGATAISVTVIGLTEGAPWRRSSAKPGDIILVTGTLGGSILQKHLTFAPRVKEALNLNANYKINAGMDITDGLSLDLSRLVQASDCGAELELDKIPISPVAHELSAVDGKSPLQHALSDGEDFELLFTMPADEAHGLQREQPYSCRVTAIGRVVEDHGVWQVQPNGQPTLMPVEGYVHRFG